MLDCPARRLRLRLLSALFCLCLPGWTVADDVLRIGAEDDWYPYTALRDGQVQGMSVDIVRAAFAASNTRIELQPYPYSRCMELTRIGQLAACFNTAPDARIASEFRLPEEALFSDEILLWANRNQAAPVTDLKQLAGRQVAVTIGYEYGSAFDSNRDLLRVPVRRDRNGFRMLQHGRVEFTAAYRGTAQALFREEPELRDAFSPVATLLQAKLYLSFSRYHPQAEAMQQRFDQGMRTIRQNGRYQQILAQWQHQQEAD
ncbi:transporter substrate-binding domain-containing protein [Pseudomonas sp. J452]|uniref:substrate-binding periplasmic protein n=1 Tax=Pseudomonas sp. J452 TaxID=2898441 RepID=UPI0021ADA867|nr:transporter substrate-binding domain-containing protein [Pseudomonas sp. J452]UUY09678.1 transporter substrate-binding domain-containing protein [Pseudomonas sp. J452]